MITCEELRVLESICGTGQIPMLWGYVSPFGQGLLLLFVCDKQPKHA